MAHNSDYTRIYATSSAGLSIEEVGQALGTLSRDLGVLCSDKKLQGGSWVDADRTNEWSAVKPVRHNTPGVLSAAQRAEAAQGFDLDGIYIETGYKAEIYGMAVTNAGKWPYLPPRGVAGSSLNPGNVNEYFRLLDFDGYHAPGYVDTTSHEHTAVCPTDIDNATAGGAGTTNITAYCNEYAELPVDSLVGATGLDASFNINNAYLYLLYKRSDVAQVYAVQSWDDINDQKMIYSNFKSQGSAIFQPDLTIAATDKTVTWSMVVAISDCNNPDASGNWLYLPETFKTFTVKREYNCLAVALAESAGSYANSFVVTRFNNNTSITVAMDFWITNALESNDDITGIVATADLYYDTSGVPASATATRAILEGGESDDFSLSITVNNDVPASATLDDITLIVKFEYYINYGSVKYTRYFNFSVDVSQTAMTSAMSLQDIQDAYNI